MMPGPYPERRRETPPTANLAHRLKRGMFADIRPLSPPEVDADFPAMSVGVRSAEVLRHQLTVAEYALSPNGWLRQWFKAMARLAGTDGKRLSIIRIADFPLDSDGIVPATRLLKSKLLDRPNGAIGLFAAKQHKYLQIHAGPWKYEVRCIEGVFPNYPQVLPPPEATFPARIEIDTADMKLIESTICQFVGKGADDPIYLYVGNGRAAILDGYVKGNNTPSCVVLPTSAATADQPLIQAVSGNYLLEALKAEFTTIELSGDGRPMRLTVNDDLHVLMPQICEDLTATIEFMNKHLSSHTEFQNMPEPITRSTSEPETVPPENTAVSEVTAVSEDPQNIDKAAAAAANPVERPQFKIIANDPLEELAQAIDDAQALMQHANNAARELKNKVRNLKRFYRSREKDFESAGKLIEKLKDAVNL